MAGKGKLTFGRFGRLTIYLLLVIIAFTVIGAIFAVIPFVGPLGSIIQSLLGPWFVIIAAVGIFILFRIWRRGRKRRPLVFALIGAFALAGTVYIQSRLLETASDNGASISLMQVFGLGSEIYSDATVETAIYTNHDAIDLPIDIIRPPAKAGSPLAPILVYVHGGGWIGGTNKGRIEDRRWFAERGLVVMSVEYSLSSEKRHLWDVTLPQIGCALAWIAANAARYGGDPSRISIYGDSAGGNLVLNAAYMAGNETLEPSCPGELPKIGAVVSVYPVADVANFYYNDDLMMGGFARGMAEQYTGGSPEAYPERYESVSSFTHISSAAPPTLLLVGESDHLVPPEPAYDFHKKIQEAGVKSRLIRVPYGDHGFEGLSRSINNQLFRQTSLQFIEEQGLAP